MLDLLLNVLILASALFAVFNAYRWGYAKGSAEVYAKWADTLQEGREALRRAEDLHTQRERQIDAARKGMQ